MFASRVLNALGPRRLASYMSCSRGTYHTPSYVRLSTVVEPSSWRATRHYTPPVFSPHPSSSSSSSYSSSPSDVNSSGPSVASGNADANSGSSSSKRVTFSSRPHRGVPVPFPSSSVPTPPPSSPTAVSPSSSSSSSSSAATKSVSKITAGDVDPLVWATMDPDDLGGTPLVQLQNFVQGRWVKSSEQERFRTLPDPLTGRPMLQVPDTTVEELTPYVESMQACPKSGLHNPFKQPDRYLLYGQVSRRLAELLYQPKVLDYFTRAIQRVCPKSKTQAEGEVKVTRAFLENFSGDQVRFLATGTHSPGDHLGQMSTGYRWPFGPVALICPFNFPMEIPVLQLMGALFMGNKVLLKPDQRVSMVMEQFLRMMHYCGAPLHDVDLLQAEGPVTNELIKRAPFRLTQFTGSSTVAEHLATQTGGRVRLEDAGFDWKILGPDVTDVEYVAWQSDQDAYACTGQKCSAQSILFVHQNWVQQANIYDRLRDIAARRSLRNLTIGPLLSVSTDRFMNHIDSLLAIPGARVLWGGQPLKNHCIPSEYGAVEPTAVFVPLSQLLRPDYFELCCTEIFGPFQIITEYQDNQTHLLLEACERMSHHLTAAIVSNDPQFVNEILGSTVNGTTYTGIRGRTTGAPQNHWFGPTGDPRAAGIGTADAIRLVWSSHREVILDQGPVPAKWIQPPPS